MKYILVAQKNQAIGHCESNGATIPLSVSLPNAYHILKSFQCETCHNVIIKHATRP